MSEPINNNIDTEEGSLGSLQSITVKQTEITPFNIQELTEGDLEQGKGVFDVLTRTLRLHLDREWSASRITGTEYATVYTELMLGTLAQSVDYVSRRAILGYQIQGMENDNAYKMAQVEIAREELRKIPFQIEQIQAETALIGVNTEGATANLAKVPVEVELLRKESLKSDAEIALTEKNVERLTGEVSKIPHEVAILGKQASQIEAQTALTEAQRTRAVTETEQLLPLEIANVSKQGLILDEQVTLTGHQSELARLQATVIPVDISYKQAQIAHMSRQNLLLERELDIKVGELRLQEKQIELAEVQLEVQREELEVKKAQVTAQEAQSELYRQKVVTEKAQVDPSVVLPNSVIDLNNKVLDGQVMAYRFDAQNRTAKLLLDTFVTTYSQGDRSVNTSNKLTDVDIGKVMSTMYTTIGVTD